MKERVLVLPGEDLGSAHDLTPTTGVAQVGNRIVSLSGGLRAEYNGKISVIPINGKYEPRPGDTCVGIVAQANPGNWIIDLGAPWLAPLHVSEAPWRVDFGETMAYLRPGDAILCKVLFVDEQKKVQVTLKDRNLMKLDGGEILEVPAVKVARIIGKNGSMLNLLKEYLECWMFVGQNGRIWLNGESKDVILAKKVITMISDEAHLPAVTDRVRSLLETERPGGVDAGFEEE